MRVSGPGRASLTLCGGILCLAVVLTGCDGDSDATTTTSIASTTTTTVTLTTTIATTTTTVPASTTSLAATTTTVAPTTTTNPPTTSVSLSDEGLQAADTWVPFGTRDEATIAAVSSVLGSPTTDSGWVDAFSVYGTCPSPVVRGVHFGDLVLLFTQADTDFWTGGVPHFFSYYYGGTSDPDLLTTEGLGRGSTVAELQTIYGGPGFVLVEWEFDPTVGFWSTNHFGVTQLYGYTTGLDPTDTVTGINGGQGCGE